MVYERVRGWTSGRSLPVLNFVKYPPGAQCNQAEDSVSQVLPLSLVSDVVRESEKDCNWRLCPAYCVKDTGQNMCSLCAVSRNSSGEDLRDHSK